MPDLHLRKDNKGGQHDYRRYRRNNFPAKPIGNEVFDGPSNDNQQAQHRQVHISVCYCLRTHLDQPNHRHKCPDVPQPSDRDILFTTAHINAKEGYQDKQQCACHYRDIRKTRAGMWVIYS